jgi:hypothetical protein
MPRKAYEKTAFRAAEQANTEQRKGLGGLRTFGSKHLSIKGLFLTAILLDTPFLRPYYAARKF